MIVAAIITGGLAFYLLTAAAKILLAGELATISYQETVMAALLGVFLFNETMTALQVLGGVLIVGGGVFQIFFSTKKNQPAVEESAEGLAGMH